MKNNYLDKIKNCYNLTAEEYSLKFIDELKYKPFDRDILNRFSKMLSKESTLYDIGCGSGQITKYFYDKNKFKIIGLDFAEKSIDIARKNFPGIQFKIDNMLNSKMKSSSANGIVAFYSIVHFNYKDVKIALREWYRLLKRDSFCLFSFHVGEGTLQVKNFLEVNKAEATWRLLDVDKIIKIAESLGFKIIEAIIRYPYKGYEHESKRAYIILNK